MRLFIAVNFSSKIKTELLENIDKLKKIARKGNFTREENLHLTVVFIGETSRLSDVKSAMDGIAADSFELTVGGMGKFKRGGGDIYWVGVEKNDILNKIYNNLSSDLRGFGFEIEKREFKPHITLGREVALSDKLNFDVPKISMNVNKISLMKSERINGKMIYTEIYSKKLTEELG